MEEETPKPSTHSAGELVTDQDKINRFPDGQPVSPLSEPSYPWHTLAEIAVTWTIVLAVLFGTFYLMFALVSERRAHAEEPRDPSVTIFEQPGECFIDSELHVTGKKRAACVEKLETAARLAKMEMLVNAGKRRR